MQTTWLDWRSKWRRKKRPWNRLASLVWNARDVVFDILIWIHYKAFVSQYIFRLGQANDMFDQTVIH